MQPLITTTTHNTGLTMVLDYQFGLGISLPQSRRHNL